jgi:peroxiredoxin
VDLIAVGERLPDAELLDVHANPTTLLAQLGGRPGVLVFYRGAWCPFCNIALNAYQAELLPALTDRGVGLVAVSPQKPDGSLSMQEKNSLTFAVVSDPGNQLADAAGILTGPSEEARAAQVELGLDLTQVNADGTIGLPMPTVAILDGDGTVLWIDVHPDYSTRTEPAQVLAAIDRLGA